MREKIATDELVGPSGTLGTEIRDVDDLLKDYAEIERLGDSRNGGRDLHLDERPPESIKIFC